VNAAAFLNKWLRGSERLAVVGVGSTLRADDAAGMMIAERLLEEYPREAHPRLLVCPGETAPENYSGCIRAFKPTHILVIDAADVGLAPGEIVEIPPETVGGPAFLSHMLPLKVMINYLADGTDAKSALLGIQVQSMQFDGPMTTAVLNAVDILSDALRQNIREYLL
jgi:hydrogenase 3 maturation protease